MIKVLGAALLTAAFAPVAQAATADFEFIVEQVGADVVITGDGAITTDDFNINTASPGFGPFIFPANAAITIGVPNGIFGATDFPVGAVFASPLPAFGSGLFETATSAEGDFFGIEANQITFLNTYASGDPLSGSATFAGATLASLGLDPGHYEAELANGETIGLTIRAPAVIPLPATLPLALAGAGLLLAAGRRRARD